MSDFEDDLVMGRGQSTPAKIFRHSKIVTGGIIIRKYADDSEGNK